MQTNRHLGWKHRSLGAVAMGMTVAAMAAPVALGDGRSPDTLDAVYAVNNTATQDGWYQGAVQQNLAIADGRSPDTVDAALSISGIGIGLQDGWYQSALEQSSVISDGRSPDTLNAVSAAQAASLDLRSPDTLDAVYAVSQGPVVADGRSPDTRDAAYVARQPSGVAGQPGFVWGDAAIGFSVAVGLGLLGMALYLAFRRHDKSGLSMPHVPA